MGGRNLDWSIVQKVADDFKEEFGLESNPKNDEKAKLNLFNSVEKARIALIGDI